MVKWGALAALVFVLGGIGGVFLDRSVLPRLRTSALGEKSELLRRLGENVTIINRTEQITVREDDSVNAIASRAAASVVNIISLAEDSSRTRSFKAQQPKSQSGTGVIMTSDGLIVTYRSAIIESDASYKVFLQSSQVHDAELLGIDEFTNLAYLKVNADNLSAVSLGNSDDLRPGKKLIAIGNSFGEYQNRFSAGLLSNVAKTFPISGQALSSSEKLEGVFETDFNNQREYVGGPVVSYSGDLAGIVGVAMVDGAAHYFQIPSNKVKESLARAIAGEFGERSVLGVYYVPITKEYAIANGLPSDRGALIYSPSGNQGLAVIHGSAGEKAGLRIGDIVTMVGNKGVNLDNPLANLVSEYKKGEKMQLTIIRANEEKKIEVQL